MPGKAPYAEQNRIEISFEWGTDADLEVEIRCESGVTPKSFASEPDQGRLDILLEHLEERKIIYVRTDATAYTDLDVYVSSPWGVVEHATSLNARGLDSRWPLFSIDVKNNTVEFSQGVHIEAIWEGDAAPGLEIWDTNEHRALTMKENNGEFAYALQHDQAYIAAFVPDEGETNVNVFVKTPTGGFTETFRLTDDKPVKIIPLWPLFYFAQSFPSMLDVLMTDAFSDDALEYARKLEALSHEQAQVPKVWLCEQEQWVHMSGVYVSPDATYVGQWSDDGPHGEGIMIMGQIGDVDGCWMMRGAQVYYIGSWERGLTHGRGMLVSGGGPVFIGEFNHGVPVFCQTPWRPGNVTEVELFGRKGFFLPGADKPGLHGIWLNSDPFVGTIIDEEAHGVRYYLDCHTSSMGIWREDGLSLELWDYPGGWSVAISRDGDTWSWLDSFYGHRSPVVEFFSHYGSFRCWETDEGGE